MSYLLTKFQEHAIENETPPRNPHQIKHNYSFQLILFPVLLLFKFKNTVYNGTAINLATNEYTIGKNTNQ